MTNRSQAIRARRCFAGHGVYRVLEPVELLGSVSVARSPYAALDAQTMLRAVVRFDRPARARHE